MQFFSGVCVFEGGIIGNADICSKMLISSWNMLIFMMKMLISHKKCW